MAETLCGMFQESVRKFAGLPALLHKVNGEFTAITYAELGRDVRTLATALHKTGIRKGDRVALLSENRPEWAVSDLAILHAGGVNVGIFPTLPVAQVEYMLRDSGAACVIVSGQEQLAKVIAARRSLPALRVIRINGAEDGSSGVVSYASLMKESASAPLTDEAFEALWSSIAPDDWASIIYTSGTTAEPMGAILTHRNFVSNYRTARNILRFQPGDVLLSFVPLNHVFGRMVDHYLPLSLGSAIAYVENLRRLKLNMQEVRPHYMAVVPRLLEMFEEGLAGSFAKEGGLRRKLVGWAFAAEMRRAEDPRAGWLSALQCRIADRLVFSSIRKRLGLDRLRFFFAGGAPVARHTLQFFSALQLPVMEGYGLSETSPLVSVNPPECIKAGTVGKPFEGVEVRIAHDGEILVRGPNVMRGYYNRPQETSNAIDPDGWLHTGDIGSIDEDGYLTITDRKKNLIVLANGKKVLPQHVESLLLTSPFIAQAVVVGDSRSTIGALIVPAFQRVREWCEEQALPLESDADAALARLPQVRSLVRREVQRLTSGLADYEKVRAFALLDRELTMDAGELTPTLKVKRRVVLEKYTDVVDSLYAPNQA